MNEFDEGLDQTEKLIPFIKHQQLTSSNFENRSERNVGFSYLLRIEFYWMSTYDGTISSIQNEYIYGIIGGGQTLG